MITKSKTNWAALAVAAAVIVAGCSGDDGLSPAEVPVPPKSDPAAYTQYFVESAIARYDTEGLDATLAHYNSPDSVDGPWYVFVGLLFGSGWYIDFEQFLPALIAESAEHFRAGGLEAILAFYNDPQGISVGLIPTVEYYNSTNTLDGYFSGFIAAPDGEILRHFDPAIIGTDIEDLLGPAVRNAGPQGTWITAEDNDPTAGGPETMSIWALNVDGTLIGGGWYNYGSGN